MYATAMPQIIYSLIIKLSVRGMMVCRVHPLGAHGPLGELQMIPQLRKSDFDTQNNTRRVLKGCKKTRI